VRQRRDFLMPPVSLLLNCGYCDEACARPHVMPATLKLIAFRTTSRLDQLSVCDYVHSLWSLYSLEEGFLELLNAEQPEAGMTFSGRNVSVSRFEHGTLSVSSYTRDKNLLDLIKS
jgi:hypothetical protein